MRKQQQKQIMEILASIEEAQTLGGYADCQDVALALCDFIESIKGEGTQTAALLVEYCELLFKASNGELNKKTLHKHLIKIVNSARHELRPTKIEVVFFPYMASMADSLESIYMAAKNDPDCDAYWCPIPYYDLNPDRTLGQLHYEGHLYPAHLSAIDWQTYDLEERRPDVIFAHNPYDKNNVVTCVHPNFFFERMQQYTDMLCYVPYFVGIDDVQEHFCVLPGTIYADKVFVRSEKVRETYVRVFGEWVKQVGIGKGHPLWGKVARPAEKFVALGSPKIDAIVNAKPGDFDLPDEWRRIMEGPDGGKKKVVMYNNRFTDMTAGIENQIAKVKSVLESFKKRDDIVLWWRPHPLNIECLHAMMPQCFAEYEHIVDEYKHGGWGVYDDTPDLARAVAHSDAYYGDWSSLVPMYEASGKFAVLQENEAGNKMALKFGDFDVDEDGVIWGFELMQDGLFKLDFKTNTAYCVTRSGCVPQCQGKKYLFSTHRYIRIYCSGDDVLCFPCFLDNILIYNRKNKTTKKLQLEQEYLLSPESDGFAFLYITEHRGKIYCFGASTKAVVVFDSSTHDISYNTSLFDVIGLMSTDNTLTKFPRYVSECSEDGSTTMLMNDCEHLISYNLPTQNVEIIVTNPILADCACAGFDGQYYWLLSNNNKFVKWDSDLNAVTEYNIPNDMISNIYLEDTFAGISDCGEYLIIFPGYGKSVLRFDKKLERFSVFNDMPVPKDDEHRVYKYDRPKHMEDKTYAFARHNNIMYEFDKSSGLITAHPFCLDRESNHIFYDDYIDYINASHNDEIIDCKGFVLHESRFADTMDFFATVLPKTARYGMAWNDVMQERDYRNIFAGESIYKHIREGMRQ